ncbi:MAG: DUF1015 domain-containing protein [Cyclobacteriaceae bacterium]|nr:DUF1015 domain-containing protein [Cyclobacteriaceae bacterium]
MAEIRPIRAWRYAPELNIDDLTSPLFDVVSDRQRKALYQHPFNSIHLSVPRGPASQAGALLARWKKDGILLHDKLPAIYVYYQYFALAGQSARFCRKGFVAHIRVHEWEEQVILRHENTIPQAVNDRIALLEHTQLHSSPTHGLYTDTSFALERYMDEAIQSPLYETEDYQGVRDVLAVIHDAQVIRQFVSVLADKQIILADGHHRYESSITYQQQRKRSNPHHTGEEGYNFHLMYLTNTEAGDLRILPTHRLIHHLNDFSEESILNKLENDFVIKAVDEPDALYDVIQGKKWAFGLLFRDNAYKVRLKPERFAALPWPFPEVVKQLDLTVMHYFIIEKALGIPGKAQRSSLHITFDRSFTDCTAKVLKGEAQLAIITQEVSIDEVKDVCASGYTMPQKSTYFYPKVIAGFLFSSVADSE